uniref:Alcohol dehydrogenase 7 (class IV), mu or sigma polypeptide n=1 Tax=Monodon monoceros TaxID=40151 RepID=A0A8C6BH56_MONMO
MRRAGSTLHCGTWASHCCGFSCCGAQVLGAQASVVVACSLGSCGSRHMTKGAIVSKFPVTVGHEATGVVESIGEGVTMVKPGVTVIPVFLPQCRECKACRDPDGNLCVTFDVSNSITGHGVLADGTTRFTCRGKPVYHFMSTSTFTEYTVVDETSVAKIDDEAHPEKVSSRVTRGSTCVAFGLGRVGLLVIMGCKSAGASRIIGIDLNKDKFEKAVAVRAIKCISPKDSTKPINEVLSEMTGEASLVIDALASCSMNYGVGVVVGAPLSAKMLTYDPVLLCAGCTRKGCVFGGWESRDDVPKLVTDFLEKKFDLDQVTTHVFPFKQINEAWGCIYLFKLVFLVSSDKYPEVELLGHRVALL